MFRGLIFTILLIYSDLVQEASCYKESDISPHPEDIFSTLDTVRQKIFVKDEFHYLNVTRVRSFTVYDSFDCTFECLSNPSCLSMNLAASRGAKGQFWCELLSSDKYRNSTEYEGNRSSHHFSIKSPCSSTPCQNEGTCVANYKYDSFECLCAKFASGKNCEKVPESCKKLYDVYTPRESQLVTLQVDSKPTSVYCHMGDFGCGNGGWTPVMKIDGSKANFHYNSAYWSNKSEYNLFGGETGFDLQETKLPTYWNTSFSKICIGMRIGQQMKFTVINKQANSLYSVIADGQYRATSLGRNSWKTLIGPEASLQIGCNKEGFNAESSDSFSKARIGIIGNDQNDCTTCDSRIGFGSGGNSDDSNTCGNVAFVSPDNGDKNIKAIGYILVQ